MFYTFRQNNSGGWLAKDHNFDQYVIIEAVDADQANVRFLELGPELSYCQCCGERWGDVYDGDGTEAPEIYGDPVNEYVPYGRNNNAAIVHYLDGHKDKIKFIKECL